MIVPAQVSNTNQFIIYNLPPSPVEFTILKLVFLKIQRIIFLFTQAIVIFWSQFNEIEIDIEAGTNKRCMLGLEYGIIYV